jgi:hypothetical protein
MAYPLQRLLQVRMLREQSAACEVLAAQRRLEKARAALRAAEKALADFLVWRAAEEERLFARIRKKEIAYRRLEDHLLDISLLRAREAGFHLRIQEAQKVCREREDELGRARKAHQAAIQAEHKIEEHRKIWQSDEVVRQAAEEDREMEEFTGRKAIVGTES